MLKRTKHLVAMLLAAYFLIFNTSPAIAGMIGSLQSFDDVRAADTLTVQRTLEMKIVGEKLEAYGLTADEVSGKLAELSDEEVHMLATASDDLLAAGDSVTGLVILLILIVVLVKLLDGTIIIR